MFSRIAGLVVLGMPLLLAAALPTDLEVLRRSISPSQMLDSATTPGGSINFPDPSIFLLYQETYYAYSTTSLGANVPVASLPTSADITGGSQKFAYKGDALPLTSKPSWIADDAGIWAPDVALLHPADGSQQLAMTFSANLAGGNGIHCVGIATSTSPTGPFTPVSEAQWAPICGNDSEGQVGAIDSSYFWDQDGTLYLLYKIDGNSAGKTTRIMKQQVAGDGFTKVGSPVQLLVNGDGDGGIIEAPSMSYRNGWYILFYSSNLYSTTSYDVSWVYSTSVNGPFVRLDTAANAHRLFVSNGENSFIAPGGMDCRSEAPLLCAFHQSVDASNIPETRVMMTAKLEVSTDAAGKPYIEKYT